MSNTLTTSSTLLTKLPFNAGDIVVSLVGDVNGVGTYGDNQATPIILEEIDPTTDTVVGEMELSQTTTTNSAGVVENAISGEYGSSSEGSLELAGNGESLVIAGYGINAATFNNGGAAQYGTAALAQSTSVPGGAYTPVARVIADISYNGTVDTSTALFNVFNLNNPRSVATINGSTFYISGQGNKTTPEQGVFLADDGASSATQIDGSTDTRTVEIVNGQLYVSRDSSEASTGDGTIDNYGSTLPTSETTGTALTGIGPSVTLSNGDGNSLNGSSGTVYLSPENFFFANSTTLYIADGGQPKTGGAGDGGLQKWTYNTTSDTWQLDYTLTAGLGLVSNTNTDGSTGLIGMTATVNGNGTVTFYVTNSTIADLDQTSLYTITDTLADTTASQASSETFATLITAYDGSNGSATDNIRGVAFAPTAPTSTPTPITVASGTTSSGAVVSSGGTLTVASGGVVNGATILSAGTAYISGADSSTYIAEGGQEMVIGSAAYDAVYGEQVVTSGGVVSGEAVFNNGDIGLTSGATASNTTVNSGGLLVLSGGGTADNISISGGTVVLDTSSDTAGGSIVFTGAGEIILNGGAVLSGAVVSGFAVNDVIDITNIGTGATLTSATSGGNTVVTVASGGVSESFVFSGTSYKAGYFELTGDPELTVNPEVALNEIIVSSGVTSGGLVITSGFTLVVDQGGTDSDASIQSSGSASIIGVDSGTTILSGGNVTVIGSETSATVSSGGSLVIDGTDSGSTILAGGNENVSGTATGDAVYGTQLVSASAAYVGGETVYRGGAIDLFLKGAIASGVTVNSGGALVVSGAAIVENAVLSGGTLILESPKPLLTGSLLFEGAGTLELTSNTTTSAGAYGDEAVISGFGAGDVISITSMGAGSFLGSQTVSGGNTEITVYSGSVTESFLFSGTGAAFGLSSGTGSIGISIVSGGGNITQPTVIQVASGVTSGSLPTIAAGTDLLVYSGGTVSNAVISGGFAEVFGTADTTTISKGGTATLLGVASGVNLKSGKLTDEGTASAVTVSNGGTLSLTSAGIASNVTVSSGGTLVDNSTSAVLSGALDFAASGTVSFSSSGSYNEAAVISGFTTGDAIVLASVGTGAVLISTAVAGNTDVLVVSGGTEDSFVFSGTGATYGLTSVTGGVEIVSGTGGIAQPTEIVVSSGVTSGGLSIPSGTDLIVLSGGVDSGNIVHSGAAALVFGTESGTTVLSGGNASVFGEVIQDVVSGGMTVLTGAGLVSGTIAATGNVTIDGTDTDTTIQAGGLEFVSSTATGDQIYGTQQISAGSPTVTSETVYSGGVLDIYKSSATANNTTIEGGGQAVISGSGIADNVALSNGGTITLQTTSSTVEGDIVLSGMGNTLIEQAAPASGAGFGGLIFGFNENQNLDLSFLGTNGTSLTSSTQDGYTDLTVTSGSFSQSFAFAGTGAVFTLGTGPTVDISNNAPCFAGGTRLLGVEGDVLVEDVKPGDVLVTVREGGPVTQKVVWTGKRAINIARHPAPELVRPVRIVAGAFGAGLPERDLRLSPDHAVYVDGALFTAISLVNGHTIYQEQNCAHVTYHHIELESHDIVLAEGLPAESFLDTGNREMFETVSGVMALHADFTARSENGFCVKLVRDGEALDNLRARLAERAALRHVA